MKTAREALAAMAAATLTSLLCTPSFSQEDAPVGPTTRAAPEPANERSPVDAVPDYAELMKMKLEARLKLVADLGEADRAKFLATLSGERKAVLATDPDDCSAPAKLTRFSLATGKADEGFASNTLQDIGQSVSTGLLNLAVPGLGSLLSTAARVNELNKLRQQGAAYKDVCDMTPEERDALFAPVAAPAANGAKGGSREPEESLLDRASRFFAR